MNVDKEKYTRSQRDERPDSKNVFKEKKKDCFLKREAIFFHFVYIPFFIQHLKWPWDFT